jgi:prepilin peptidase CpaA
MSSLPLTIRVILAITVLTAAIYDCRYRRIPNWLNSSGLILGFGLNIFFFQTQGALSAGEGLCFAMAVYLPLYLLRGMGAGDVKLMAAVGTLVGPANWFVIFVATALVGGAAGGVFALFKKRFSETCCNTYFLAKDLLQFRLPYRTNPQLDFRNPSSLRLPHGLLIALGCLLALACSITLRSGTLRFF